MTREIARKAMLGHKIRRFRREQGLSQTAMAEMLGISASYLNLIEHNQRPVTVPLLFRLGQTFEIDLKAFAADESAELAAGLREVLADPLFQGQAPPEQEIRELAAAGPATVQAVLTLYRAYAELREEAHAIAERLADHDRGQPSGGLGSALEEVRDFLQAEGNHFPELEAAAEELRRGLDGAGRDLFGALAEHAEAALGYGVRVMPVEVMAETLRRHDLHRRRVLLSEALPPASRSFQLAAQIALLGYRDLIERIAARLRSNGEEAKRPARAALANYFAGAVLLPYESFHAAARELRYDLERLQRRFGASFEQVCHRLTTLNRAGDRGIPFFFVRLDHAGNVSKRLSAGGFPFARFGGTCPRWVVHDAFRTPGEIRSQLAEMPDGSSYLMIARTLAPHPSAGGRALSRHAVSLGCEAGHARQLVYGDGFEPKRRRRPAPIGVNCRICERLDCVDRAQPALNQPLQIDEGTRRLSPFVAPAF